MSDISHLIFSINIYFLVWTTSFHLVRQEELCVSHFTLISCEKMKNKFKIWSVMSWRTMDVWNQTHFLFLPLRNYDKARCFKSSIHGWREEPRLLGQSRLIKKYPTCPLWQYKSCRPKDFYPAQAQQNLCPGDRKLFQKQKLSPQMSQEQKLCPGVKVMSWGQINVLSLGQKILSPGQDFCTGEKIFVPTNP